jgi:hypothetical protein
VKMLITNRIGRMIFLNGLRRMFFIFLSPGTRRLKHGRWQTQPAQYKRFVFAWALS